jgi:hypothetical protein
MLPIGSRVWQRADAGSPRLGHRPPVQLTSFRASRHRERAWLRHDTPLLRMQMRTLAEDE